MSNSQIEDPKDTSVYYKMWWVFNIFIWYHCPSDNRDVHSMVEDCIVSPHNHLAEGDYCRDTKFQNGCLAFFQCCRWSHKHYRRKLNFEGTKDAAKFCETLQNNNVKLLLIEWNKIGWLSSNQRTKQL